MTIKFFSNMSIKYRRPCLLSIAVLSSALFINSAIAADDSTLLQDINSLLGAPSRFLFDAAPVCPLNSGGVPLSNTTWRLNSIYGNKIPEALKINMHVNEDVLTGNGGCNEYSARFKRVGKSNFSVKAVTKTRKACRVIIPYKTAPSINVGSWEGSYLRTLKRMESVRQITDGGLQFFNRNGDIAMTFSKITDDDSKLIDDKNKQAAKATEKAATIAQAN